MQNSIQRLWMPKQSLDRHYSPKVCSTIHLEEALHGVHKHVSFNRPPQSCPLVSTIQILNAFSSSSSPSYFSCSEEGGELEGLSGPKCSIIHVQTSESILGPATSSLVPTTLPRTPKQLRVATSPNEKTQVLSPHRNRIRHLVIYLADMFRFPVLILFPGIYSSC